MQAQSSRGFLERPLANYASFGMVSSFGTSLPAYSMPPMSVMLPMFPMAPCLAEARCGRPSHMALTGSPSPSRCCSPQFFSALVISGIASPSAVLSFVLDTAQDTFVYLPFVFLAPRWAEHSARLPVWLWPPLRPGHPPSAT
jgi:hypothetical protein